MKKIAILLSLLATGCVGVSDYHPATAYPTTPNPVTAITRCVYEATSEVHPPPGLLPALIDASAINDAQDACMYRHGWARN